MTGMEPRQRRIPGAGGLTLNLLEWSEEGVPMILIHGFSNEARIWDDFVPGVADHYRVLALDQRGHGESDWHPDAAYDYDDFVADLEAVVDGLGIDRCVIVGHSLGGRVAMLYAGRHPEKLAGLVIVDSAPELDRRGTTRISMDTAEHKDPTFGSVAEYERTLAHAYPAATAASLKRMAQYGVRKTEDGRYALRMDTAFRGSVAGAQADAAAIEARHEAYREEMWTALEKISCPTLVVRGAASDVVSADVADRMVDESLEKGQLAVIPQAGHSVMTDNPEGFNDAVESFVLGS
ncbi:MAG: alpha/beta fold hydrolase [Myxococcota bacterium]